MAVQTGPRSTPTSAAPLRLASTSPVRRVSFARALEPISAEYVWIPISDAIRSYHDFFTAHCFGQVDPRCVQLGDFLDSQILLRKGALLGDGCGTRAHEHVERPIDTRIRKTLEVGYSFTQRPRPPNHSCSGLCFSFTSPPFVRQWSLR